MAERGFALDQRHAPHFLDFRRYLGPEVHFAEIQWEKYGAPRFALNVGKASIGGTLCHGEHVPAGEMGPGQAPEYVRVYPRGDGSSTRHWFRQDRTWFELVRTGSRLRPADEVVSDLIHLFAEAEHYLSDGTLGPHCRRTTNFWARNAA